MHRVMPGLSRHPRLIDSTQDVDAGCRLRGMTVRSKKENAHAENLGPQHLVQRAEGDVGGGRDSKLPHERIDVGGAFGKTKEPSYLAMNPNSPGADAGGRRRLHAVGIEFDRALSRRQARQAGTLEPNDAKQRALAQPDGWTGSCR